MCRVSGRGVAHTEFWCGNQKGIEYLEDLGVEGKVILKCMLMMFNEKALNGSGLGRGKEASSCARGNKLAVSITCGESLD